MSCDRYGQTLSGCHASHLHPTQQLMPQHRMTFRCHNLFLTVRQLIQFPGDPGGNQELVSFLVLGSKELWPLSSFLSFIKIFMCCLTKEITPCFLCYHLPPCSPPAVLIVYIQWWVGGKMAYFRWSKLIAMQYCEVNLKPKRKLSSHAKISCNGTPQILASLSVALLAKDPAE